MAELLAQLGFRLCGGHAIVMGFAPTAASAGEGVGELARRLQRRGGRDVAQEGIHGGAAARSEGVQGVHEDHHRSPITGAVASGERQDGFSWPYQASVAAAGLLYGVLGLTLLGSFLRRWFDRAVAIATLLVLTFGTNLFHYMTYDAGYSHAFSFAVVAFVLCGMTQSMFAHQTTASVYAAFGGLLLGMALREARWSPADGPPPAR